MTKSSRALLAGIIGLSAACSHANDDVYPPSDAGAPQADGASLGSFTPPSDPGAGGVLFAASGEALALTGYAFPPAQPDNPAFVDGWEVKFARLLVTIDDVVLAANPDKVPGDESQTDGPVAIVKGPWAIDLSHGDPSYLPGKGGPGEQAIPFAALSKQSNGDPFPTDGTRFAFGFDLVAATAQGTKNVNLDAAGLADYADMVANGCVVLYVGTATFRGDKTNATCYRDAYKEWPDVVDFKLCFKSPTTYVNCQNPDNKGTPFPSEESQRGVAFDASKSVIAQVTIHTDHPFWDSVLHDSPLHFDPFAARVAGQGRDGGARRTVTLEATRGVDYTAYTDALGNELSWRYCIEPPTDVHPKLTGPMAFDPEGVPHATNGDPRTGLRDYYDFSTYNQSTQGHLDSDGLCYVKHDYASPR